MLISFPEALQDAQLIDPRLNIVPSARGMSSLRAGLLSFSNATATERYHPTVCIVYIDLISNSPVAYARFNGNPWVVRERNGLRGMFLRSSFSPYRMICDIVRCRMCLILLQLPWSGNANPQFYDRIQTAGYYSRQPWSSG